MSVVALVTWIITVSAGLFLLAIWLIEYDHDFQHSAATRLPIPVISAHALLALTGLAVWIGYLVLDSDRLAWTAAVIVVTGATLGLIMAARWIGVYRTFGRRPRAGQAHLRTVQPVPPERNFPLPVVVAHGAFALATVTLVVLTAIGVGGS
jgi:hypothetical protein